MYTYDVVSESVKNPHELAAELSRRSRAGWELVQIIHDGDHWVHAFVRHHGEVAVAAYPTASASVGSPEADAPRAQQPAAAPQAAQVAPAQASASAGPSGAVPNVPANWYKDPSGRFEMRYWNGTQWTEHVATAGKQSIDPPKK